MRILNITSNYLSENPQDLAGVFLHRQFLALKRLGCKIRVVNPQPMISCRMFSPYYPTKSLIDDINIYRPRFFYIPNIVKPGIKYDLFFSQAVLRALRKVSHNWKPDIIICDWIIPCGYAGVKTSELFGIPLILRARGGDVRFIVNNIPRLSNYYRSIFDQADLIITNGQGLLDDLKATGIIDHGKLQNLSNGIDVSIFHPPSGKERAEARSYFNIPDEALVWVFVGTWDIHKGTRELAQTLPGVMKLISNSFFLAAGPIRDKESFREIRSECNQTHFLGMVDSQTIVQCLHAADIFILPSYAEGLPNSLLEAMACGLPSIVTKVGGIPDIIENDVNGILIEPKNTGNLEDQILRCAVDEEFRKKIGENAYHAIFEKNLDLGSVARYTNELFRSLVISDEF